MTSIADRGRGLVRRVAGWFVRHRRALIVTASSLVVVGLLLAGLGAGQLIFPRTVTAGEIVVVEQQELDAATTMPDVIGLQEAVARKVIADAGIGARIELSETPYAGDAGTVVSQKPAPGEAPGDSVEFVLSAPAQMPAVTGDTAAEARATLEALGVVVVLEPVVDPAAAVGVVVSAVPAEGDPLPRLVTLRVSDPGDAIGLADLRRIDSPGCQLRDQGTIDGTPVGDAVMCTPGSEVASIQWNLAGHATVLQTTLGVLDSGGTGSARVRVIGDGKVLSSTNVAFGATTELRVDVRGILRLKVDVVARSGDPTAVLGDPLILGTSDELALVLEGQ